MVNKTLRCKKPVADIAEKLTAWARTWNEYTTVKNTENELHLGGAWNGRVWFSLTVGDNRIGGQIERKDYQDGSAVTAIRLNSTSDFKRDMDSARRFFQDLFKENIIVERTGRRNRIAVADISQLVALDHYAPRE